MYVRKGMGMKKTDTECREIKSVEQKLFKVGYGPNLWGIVSEDSLDKYSNIVGMEEYGTRTLYYVEQETEIHYLETEEIEQ